MSWSRQGAASTGQCSVLLFGCVRTAVNIERKGEDWSTYKELINNAMRVEHRAEFALLAHVSCPARTREMSQVMDGQPPVVLLAGTLHRHTYMFAKPTKSGLGETPTGRASLGPKPSYWLTVWSRCRTWQSTWRGRVPAVPDWHSAGWPPKEPGCTATEHRGILEGRMFELCMKYGCLTASASLTLYPQQAGSRNEFPPRVRWVPGFPQVPSEF